MKSGCESKDVKKRRSIELPVLNTSGKSEISHSKTSIWRAVVLLTLTLLMVAHYLQWRVMGTTVSPIEPSETMYTLQNGAVNAGFIFFTLAILATLVFGRFVCGWGCHILALQDFCAWLLKKMGLTPKPFRSRLLVFVPIIGALYMFVWPTAYKFFAGPLNEPVFPQFTNHLVTTEFWATFPPLAVAVPFLFICGFLTVYFLGSKGFCTYACPYGGFFALADKFSPGKIRVTDACNECGHCTATCTSNVVVHSEVKEFGMVVDPGCMKCMDCISVCPNDALYFGFGKPTFSFSEPKAIKKSFSITWPEEIATAVIFAASFLAVRGVYALVPFLMALGWAAVTTFLAIMTWRLLSKSGQTFYKFDLKSDGKLRRAGWIFLIFSLIWLGITWQNGWIRYHEYAGEQAFRSLQIPDELALAQSDPSQWISPADRKNIDIGKRDLYRALDAGFFRNSDALPKLAWFEYLSGDTDKAVQRLGIAADLQTGEPRALSLYYRGAILNRMGRYDEALAALDQALLERPDLVLAREESGESLWLLGRYQEATSAWTGAVRKNQALALATEFLAGAAASMGNRELAIKLEKEAAKNTPEDPYFHWMLGMRLQNVGMNALADKHFKIAIEIDPSFQSRGR